MSKDSSTFTRRKAYFENKTQIIPNALIFSGLCDTSVRLLCALNALPANWIVNQEDIKQRLNWGKERMENAIKDCVAKGYMIVTQIRCENGRFDKNHFEFDIEPSFLNTSEEKCPHNECEPKWGNPPAVVPTAENPPLSCSLDISPIKKDREGAEDPFLPFSPIEDEDEKLQMLSTYPLDQSAKDFLLLTPLETLKESIAAMEQWRCNRAEKGNPITDACSALISAVKGKWKVQMTAADYQAAKEKEVKEYEDSLTKTKNHIFQIAKTCEGKLPHLYSIKPGPLSVEIRTGSQFCPVSYAEENVIKTVQDHVNKYWIKENV